MPELPDLQVYSQNLKKRLLNKNIVSLNVFNTRKIDTPSVFSEKLTGTSIQDIVREGKELYFLLANNNVFAVHLMLCGKFFIVQQDEAGKIGAKIMSLCFEDSQALVLSDQKEMCKVTLNPKPSTVPDALSDTFTFEYFLNQIKKKARENIKAVLIDQRVVRGIGNAYIDEILWKANISPEATAGKIPEENLKSLFQAVPFILNDAIQNIQKISPDIINGEERSFLKVHNTQKKYTDDGDKIITKTVAGKWTCFTDKQILFR